VETVLKLTHVSTQTPDGRKLCADINFGLNAGDLLLLEGENGSGKTTLIKSILGLYHFYSGQIERKFTPDDVAYLPQLGNIQFFLPLTLHNVVNLKALFDQATIEGIGLLSPSLFDRPWNSASGGERQKALLTRAFLSEAKLLVLDEPFNHIDKAARKLVIELIAKARLKGQTILLISHEHALAEFSQAKRLILTEEFST